MKRDVMRPGALSLFVVALAACGGSTGGGDAALDGAANVFCAAPRPPEEACTRGVFDVDCGGSGEPRFACSEASGRCAWFATSCVAAGYEVSDCVAGNICCHPSTAGTWPFPNDWRPRPIAHVSQTMEDVAMLGGAVITSSAPFPIDVVIDPSVSAPTADAITCDPGLDLQLCDATAVGTGVLGTAVVIIVTPTRVWPQQFIIEIQSLASGGFGARAFLEVIQDAEIPNPAQPSCGWAATPRPAPAVSGLLTLDAYDPATAASMHGHAELDIDGLAATLVF